jgi:hypothetical protein
MYVVQRLSAVTQRVADLAGWVSAKRLRKNLGLSSWFDTAAWRSSQIHLAVFQGSSWAASEWAGPEITSSPEKNNTIAVENRSLIVKISVESVEIQGLFDLPTEANILILLVHFSRNLEPFRPSKSAEIQTLILVWKTIV